MEEIKLPEGFEAEHEDGVLRVSDGDNELEKKMDNTLVEVEVSGDRVEFRPLRDKRDVKSIAGAYRGHTENMIQGLKEEYVYKMKGVYAHFPMTIKKQGEEVHIENFMGEREPRRADIMEGVNVEVNGEDLEISGSDKEKVSQTAARIEQICGKGNRDPRTFQDGVYITEKNGGAAE
ncbi:MAG: 50S ribosomal protein L6 [Candidatus Nanohaloarchaea archaeon]